MALFLVKQALQPLSAPLSDLSGRTAIFGGLAGVSLALLGLALADRQTGMALTASGVALAALVGLLWSLSQVAGWSQRRVRAELERLMADCPDPVLLSTRTTGAVLWANDCALQELDLPQHGQISDLLLGLSSDPAGLVGRLGDAAVRLGKADHRLASLDGTWHLSVRPATSDTLMWRIRTGTDRAALTGSGLCLAQFDPDGRLVRLSAAASAIWPEGAETLVDATEDGQCFRGTSGTFLLRGAPARSFGWRVPRPDGVGELLCFTPSTTQEDVLVPDLGQNLTLEDLPVAIAFLDLEGQFTLVNQEARRLLKLQGTEPLLLSDMLEGLGRPVTEWLADVGAGRLSTATEVLCLNRNGTETFLKVTLTRSLQGPRPQLIAVFSDITKLKSLEVKFTQSQKMQAIGQLAGGVAHDFNNLLTAISGHCDLMLLRHDRSDLDYPDLMQIQQNTNRAAALVRQLLALSRQQTLRLVTLDLQETMADVVHLLNRLVGEKITTTFRHSEDVAPIRADKRQFEQVLMNLVLNARDALPVGGEIRIETERVIVPDGFMRDEVKVPGGEYSVIHISDDGTGIPDALLPKIFDPFFTTKRQGEGTGLGLSTVYGIVKQSGGYIFVDSEEGVGTRFSLYFAAQKRIAPQAKAPGPTRPVSPIPQMRHAVILLVEDEAPVRSFAARALQLQGHTVIEADCGEAALEILSDPEIRPDFFVTDVVMPGIDGPGWVSQVRDRFPDTPVLFISGYAEDSRVAAQSRISNASFLGKPFSLADFTATVNAQLSQVNIAA
ncbi:MAG: ATP-binding protein [Roseinatronobacter sp.]